MDPGGRIAIVELIVGDDHDPGVAALMDLNMLAAAGGRECSVAEYDVLLAEAGLCAGPLCGRRVLRRA